MPNPKALWIVTLPTDSSPDEQLTDLNNVLGSGSGQGGAGSLMGSSTLGKATSIEFPEFKTGTLASLLQLSEALTKHDANITNSLGKIVDTIRSLTSPPAVPSPSTANRISPLESHLVIDDGRPYLEYLYPQNGGESQWNWNRSKYRTDARSLVEIVDVLVKEVASIENGQRSKTAQYALVKGQLQQAARRKAGNLSSRSLTDVVSKKDFAGTNDSEYLETVLVAVPKTAVKVWESSYERITQMVVPRSSIKLAEDDEFALFGVAIFRRVKDEFSQKCREQKFIVRDFTYDEEAIESGRSDLVKAEVSEKELWTELLRLSRINFSETFQALIHIKIIRAFIESVLRYGLPANYFVAVIKPEGKQSARLVSALSAYAVSLSPSSKKAKNAKGSNQEAPVGEFATVLEGEYLDFVLFEVDPIDVAPAV